MESTAKDKSEDTAELTDKMCNRTKISLFANFWVLLHQLFCFALIK